MHTGLRRRARSEGAGVERGVCTRGVGGWTRGRMRDRGEIEAITGEGYSAEHGTVTCRPRAVVG